MKIPQKLKELDCRLASNLQSLVDPVSLEELAREKGFIQRSSSQVTGVDFVKLLTTEILAEPRISYEGLCDRLQQLNPAVTITPQALAQRLTGAGAENYLRAVLQQSLSANLQARVAAVDSHVLAPFRRIFLQDSTQAQLHERLAAAFKGSGGSASQASVKIDLTYEVKGQTIYRLAVGAGATSDQSRAEEVVETLQATDLVILDLGYFKLTALAQMAAKGAFFLSRLLPATGAYQSERAEAEALVLARYLNQHHANQAVIELGVAVGQAERLPCRLIAYRLPAVVVNERRRRARANATKKGRPLTHAALAWLEFACFITNVPAAIWSAPVIGTLYRLRWQVGVSGEGHIIQSVQVRPRLKDSGLVAWEAPWRESKTVKPSDPVHRGCTATHQVVTCSERRSSLVTRNSGGRACPQCAKAARTVRNESEAAVLTGGVSAAT